MSNEYKEWLKEQTFESLANDNLRIKLELKTAKEENEKLKECFIPLNQKKYYCSKEVYNILEDTKNEWQRVSQLESERVMEIVKLKRENKKLLILSESLNVENQSQYNKIQNLIQQNKQMRENINNIKKLCNEDWEDMTVDKFQNQLSQALNEVNNEK